MMGDRVYPDIGYIGKDYTNLPILLQIYNVDNTDLTLEALSRLDNHAIKKSQEQLKREYDKIKRKSGGR
jgi:dUTPase